MQLIRLVEDDALARSSEFVRTYHDISIVVHNTGGDASSLHVKSEIPNKTLVKITTFIFVNSIHNKELLCLAYQYAICIVRITNNRLCGDVPYFLCNGNRPLYKHMKIWGV